MWSWRDPDFKSAKQNVSFKSALVKASANLSGDIVKTFFLLSPIPVSKSIKNKLSTEAKVLDIFDRSFKQGGGLFESLTDQEKNVLKSRGLLEAFQKKDEYLLTHPVRTRLHKGVRLAYLSSVWAFLVSNFILYDELSDSENILSFSDYLEKPLAKDEFQIVFNLVPLPHIAIRIDDRVYSFNEQHFYANYVGDYFLEQMMAERTRDSSLDFPDSKIVLTFKNTSEKITELHAFLNDKSYRTWNNVYFVNTCASETSRALKIVGIKVPKFVDASPSQIASYLLTQKKFHNQEWPKFNLVVMNNAHAPHALRAAYMSQLEAKFFMFNFVWFKATDAILASAGQYEDQPRDIPERVVKKIEGISKNEISYLYSYLTQLKTMAELNQPQANFELLKNLTQKKVLQHKEKIQQALTQERLSFEMKWHLELTLGELNKFSEELESVKR
jgi:hypothetical protein